MPNNNAPFGFADSHRLGAAVNYQMSRRWISASNPTPIFTGDPIIQLSTGYVAQASPGAAAGAPTPPSVSGIFIGCEYMSISQKKWIAVPWWPGNDAVLSGTGFDVHAKIVDDPLTVFRVQGNGLITMAMIGMNAQFAIGAGNTVTGRSGATLDCVTNPPAAGPTSVSFPFKVIDLVRDPPGSNGADPTSPFNWAYVTFNNQDYKSLQGI